MSDNGKKFGIDKLQVGTGDIDNSTTLGNNSSMTTNNNTSITVENGGTLHYKDAAAIKEQHEQRRADFNNFVDKAKEVKQDMHDHSILGVAEKALNSFEAGMDKICGCKSSRFDSAANMAPVSNKEASNNGYQR